MLNIYFGDNFVLNRQGEPVSLCKRLPLFLNLPYASTKYSTWNFDIENIFLIEYDLNDLKRGILTIKKETEITDPLFYEISTKGVWNALNLKRQDTGEDFESGIFQYKVQDAALDLFSDIFIYSVPTVSLLADGDGIFIQDFDEFLIED